MASTQQIQSFIGTYEPYAAQASQATGLNEQLILAQWGNETNWGTQFAEANNIGNVGVYGGGPNPSYGSIQEGVQAYINTIIDNPRYDAARNAQGIDAQAAALGASGYAGGGYNDGGGPGSSLIADANVVAQNGYGTAQASVAGSASPSGATADTTNQSAAASTAGGSTTTVTLPGSTDPGFNPNAQTVSGQSASALATFENDLQAYGFNANDAAALTQWAWSEMTTGVDPTQVAIDLQTPGTTGYTIFEKQFPGFVAANEGLNALGQPAMSVQLYASYQQTAEQEAKAAGLPDGFIGSWNIGAFIGAGISGTELESRINDAMTLAYQSTPEAQMMMNQYFGLADANGYLGANQTGHGPLTVGQIAAIALDPNTAEPLIKQQIQAAQIGGAGVTAGIGAIDQPTATQLAQAGITTSQATSTFQNIAPYGTLEAARPGMGGEAAQGVVTPDQLALGNLVGNVGAQRQEQTAIEVAKAPFSGGGGYVSNTKGSAVGSASSSGSGQ